MSQTYLDSEKIEDALRTLVYVFAEPETVTLEVRTRRGDEEVTTVLSIRL